jgi:hypothetical protein
MVAAWSDVTREYVLVARGFVTRDHVVAARSYVTRECVLVDRELVKAGRSVNEATYHRSVDAAMREPAVDVRDVRNVVDRCAEAATTPAAAAPAPS